MKQFRMFFIFLIIINICVDKIWNRDGVFNFEQLQQLFHSKKCRSGISFDKYYRFDEIQNYLKYLEKCYSNTVQLITIGETYEKRPLTVIKISTNIKKRQIEKPSIFIEGGIHAREWISPAQVLYIIHQLVENPNGNSRHLIDNLNWYILPVLNPDGYEYSHTTDRMWRKTRSKSTNSTCVGVDLNRNFDFHWMEFGASADPCSIVYAGPSASSEPETQALIKFGRTIQRNLKLYVAVHSAAYAIIFPWGFQTELPENGAELQMLAHQARETFVNYTDFRVGSLANVIALTGGGSYEWFKGVLNVDLTFNFELPPKSNAVGLDRFDMPPEQILSVVKDVFEGFVVLAQYISKKYGEGR